MLGWRGTTVILCSYGFWKEMRPSVPFLTPYLLSPPRNLTDADLYSRVYPFWTYSYLVMLIPMFILTDLLRYKPLIVGESLGYIGTWILLTWGSTIGQMQAMQVIYGWATAAEVAYYAYIYATIDESHYQKATSYVRAMVLCGRFVAYGLGQVLISTQSADFLHLQYISFASCLLIFLIALALPMPKTAPPAIPESQQLIGSTRTRAYFQDLMGKFRRCYSVGFVVKWSLWWAFATSGFFQVGNYIQNLWETMQEHDTANMYNGVTEALSTLLGAGAAVLVQFVHLNWPLVGEWILGVISLVDAVLLIVISQTRDLWVAYLLYVLYCVLYQMLITIATFNVASNLEADTYGLVFGWNTFIALILQTVLTFSFADAHGLALHIRTQFTVYGIYHGILGLVFLTMGIVTVKRIGLGQCWKQTREYKKPEESAQIAGESADLQGAEVYTTRT